MNCNVFWNKLILKKKNIIKLLKGKVKKNALPSQHRKNKEGYHRSKFDFIFTISLKNDFILLIKKMFKI